MRVKMLNNQIALILFLFASEAYPLESNTKFEFNKYITDRADNLIVTDFDSDYEDEIVLWQNKKEGLYPSHAIIMNSLGEHIKQLNFEGIIRNMKSIDIYQDGVKELVISEKIGDTVFLRIYSYPEFDKIIEFKAMTVSPLIKGNKIFRWDGGVTPNFAFKESDTGNNLLICTVTTSYIGNKRGIAAYDANSGELIWYYPMAAYLAQSPSLLKSYNDGAGAILITTSSTGNGITANGMNDSESHLIFLDLKGNLIKKEQLGGIFTRVMHEIIDFNKDGIDDIVTLKTGQIAEGERESRLTLWNGINLVPTLTKNLREYYNSLNAHDFVSNEKAIILMSFEGTISVLDEKLELIRNIPLGSKKCVISGFTDIDGDGMDEIEVSSTLFGIKFINYKSELIASFPNQKASSILNHGLGKSPSYIFYGDGSYAIAALIKTSEIDLNQYSFFTENTYKFIILILLILLASIGIPLIFKKPNIAVNNNANNSKVLKELTKRELEIIAFIAEGFTSKDIATKLYISPKTVDKHRQNIMSKLDIHTASGLTKFAYESGLITNIER